MRQSWRTHSSAARTLQLSRFQQSPPKHECFSRRILYQKTMRSCAQIFSGAFCAGRFIRSRDAQSRSGPHMYTTVYTRISYAKFSEGRRTAGASGVARSRLLSSEEFLCFFVATRESFQTSNASAKTSGCIQNPSYAYKNSSASRATLSTPRAQGVSRISATQKPRDTKDFLSTNNNE